MNTAEKALLNKLEAQNIDLNERIKQIDIKLLSICKIEDNVEKSVRESIISKLLSRNSDNRDILKEADKYVNYILTGKK